jgi:hypothetical protein
MLSSIPLSGSRGSEKLNYPFDRLDWLEHEGHLRRKLLFLDLKFWIWLSEPSHEHLKALLSNLVETGKLICPVSPSILMELFKRTRDTHRDSTSQLMDQLSKGLSLRFVDATFRHEFEAALDDRQVERQVAYSYFQDFFFPPPAFTLLSPGQGMETSITDFMSGHWGSLLGINAVRMQQRFLERAQQENELRQNNKPTRKEIEEAERWAVLWEMNCEIRSVLRARGYPPLKNMMRDILDRCPSFWCHYKYSTELRCHKPAKGNDLWDSLHIAMAVAYVDCLACDGATKSIMCAGTLGMDKKFGTRIISEENDLIDWLKDL